MQAKKERGAWQYPQIDRGELLARLASAMIAIEAEKSLLRLVEHALACDRYDLTDAHLAAIFALERRLAGRAGGAAATRWLAACRRRLEERTAKAPEKPLDFRRNAKLSCNCGDCRELSRFLADPDRQEGRFPLPKERRRHLHNVIESDGCDCTHATERRGRPFTLVCRKTTASYEAACKIHQRDLENLARIVALEKKRD